MKILVIGSEGFIGRYLTTALIKAGHSVKGFDLRPAHESNLPYELFKGDIMSTEDLCSAAHGCEMIINLAAKHHDFGVSREDFFKINVKGTENILSVMSRLKIDRHVFLSSVAVYGLRPEASNEDMTPAPSNDYGESKLDAEEIINKWVSENSARECLIIRPTVVFGPYNFANMFNLISTIEKKRFVRVGKGDNIKSVCYVENLVNAIMFLLPKMAPGVQVFNYSDYPHLTSGEVIDTITDSLHYKRSWFKLPLAPIVFCASIIDVVGKITKVNFKITANRIKKLNTATVHGSDKVRALGYRQEIEIKEGLRRMVEWYLKSNVVRS